MSFEAPLMIVIDAILILFIFEKINKIWKN